MLSTTDYIKCEEGPETTFCQQQWIYTIQTIYILQQVQPWKMMQSFLCEIALKWTNQPAAAGDREVTKMFTGPVKADSHIDVNVDDYLPFTQFLCILAITVNLK